MMGWSLRSAIEARRRSATSTSRDSRTESGPRRPLSTPTTGRSTRVPVNGPALSARGRQRGRRLVHRRRTTRARPLPRSRPTPAAPGVEPIRLDDGTSLGHVDVEMLEDGSAVATWVEFANSVRSSGCAASSRRVHARPRSLSPAGQGRVSGYPRIDAQGDELVLAWTEGGREKARQQIKGAVARIPK